MSENVVLNTLSEDWKVIRTVAPGAGDGLTYNVNDLGVAAAAATLDTLPTVANKFLETYKAIAFEVPNSWNAIELTFEVYEATGHALHSFTYYAYMVKDWKSILRHVCHGVCTMIATAGGPQTPTQVPRGGTTAVAWIAPSTITIVTQSWPTTVQVVDASGTSGDGVTSAGVGSVIFDRCGYRYLIVLIPANTTGLAADRIQVKASGY